MATFRARREGTRRLALSTRYGAVRGPAAMALDQHDFRELFDEERDRTYRLLVRLARDRHDAEELLQDAFVAVWRARERFEGRGSAAGYLRRTAFRLFVNRYHRIARRRRLAPEPPREEPAAATSCDAEDAEARAFVLARVREALDGLPGPLREAFVLFRMEGRSVAEIADESGTPKKTIETRIRRATLALAESLGCWPHLVSG